MIFKPAQLGMAKLDKQELVEDRKSCKKIGPCGVGKKALYLNSFYIDRRYYLPYGSISRVFKRVAMSSGGFTGKGMFASMAYLVVEYDGGKQKQCNFKDERDVDKLLEVLAKEQPQIHLLSAAGEQMLQKKEAEKAEKLRAAGVRLIEKTRLLDLHDYGWQAEKAEGLALIGRDTLAVINDNDFGMTSNADDREAFPKGLPVDATRYRITPNEPNERATQLWLLKFARPLR